MNKAFLWGLLIAFLLLVGTCQSENRPSALAVSSRQIELFNSQLDTLHEEIIASRSPGGFALLALILSVAVPITLGVILLCRSEQAAIHSDEVIRQMARHGLTSKLIETEKLLDKPQSQPRPQILKFPTLSQKRGLPGPKRVLPAAEDGDDDDDGKAIPILPTD